MIEALLALIAPHECIICAEEGALLCRDCAARLPASLPCCYHCGRASAAGRTCVPCRKSSPLYAVTAVASYEGAAKDVVWRLKFERAQAAARDIARAMKLPELPTDRRTILVHVPTATTRIRQRGYDQARLMARELSKTQGLPHVAALARTSQLRQVGASRTMRRQQLAGAFRPTGRPVQGKHVVLIDDVITSGATLEAAARVLKQAGAWRVSAAVFARA